MENMHTDVGVYMVKEEVWREIESVGKPNGCQLVEFQVVFRLSLFLVLKEELLVVYLVFSPFFSEILLPYHHYCHD